MRKYEVLCSLWVWLLSLNRMTSSSDPFPANGMISFFSKGRRKLHCVHTPHCLYPSVYGYVFWHVLCLGYCEESSSKLGLTSSSGGPGILWSMAGSVYQGLSFSAFAVSLVTVTWGLYVQSFRFISPRVTQRFTMPFNLTKVCSLIKLTQTWSSRTPINTSVIFLNW